MENQAKLTPINDAATFATLQVGERLVHCDVYTDNDYADLYWATVSKLTAKTVTLNSPDEGSWSYRTPAFRLRARWSGRPPSVEPQGEGGRGSLYRATTPEQIARVEASYAKRAQAQEAERQTRKAREAEERAAEAKRIADALDANPNVTFTPFGQLGATTYYSANVRNSNGRDCLVVIGAAQKPDRWNRDDPTALIWQGTLNYAENHGDEYSIGSMASCSPDCKGATLDALFQDAIVRVWW